jgi:predicted peptidase
MTPEVYSQWRKIKNTTFSDSGHTVIYTLEKEVGDKQLGIFYRPTKSSYIINRFNTASTSASGDFVVYTHGLSYDSLRTLKRKKVAKEKLPLDSLSIFNLKSKKIDVIQSVSSYTLPPRWSDYVMYIKTNTKESSDSTMKKRECKEQTLIVRQLLSGKEDTIHNVKEYTWAEEHPTILYSQCTGDSTLKYNVYKKDLITQKTTKLLQIDFYHVTNLALDKSGNQSAFLTLQNKSHLTKKPFKLYFHKEGEYAGTEISTMAAVPTDWNVSNDYKLKFTEDNNRLLIGFCPPFLEKDTTLLDDEIVNVEIWHHDMPKLYTQLESSLEEDRKRTYLYVFDTRLRIFHKIEDVNTSKSDISKRNMGNYALVISTLPYQKEVTWNGTSRCDAELYDFQTKSKRKILSSSWANPAISTDEKYIFWYDPLDSCWHLYDINLGQTKILASAKESTWYDELHDTPSPPDSYGIGGWVVADQAVLIYDRYDIWKVDPKDPLTAIPLTTGRDHKKVYRIVDLDRQNDYINPNQPMLLHVFDEKTKTDQYAWLNMMNGTINYFNNGQHSLSRSVIKSRIGNDLIYTSQSFIKFPDLQWTTTSFDTSVTISNANPQQIDYQWGNNKLVTWKDKNEKEVHGMLFMPHNFDPTKKYPLIVNFYEKSSNSLYNHRAPEAHRSSINYTYYTSKGYVIFNPDISYLTGQPGDDCMNAVESGVDAICALGFIDTSRMGLQGHSWGGYQIAYMLTKTHRYKCAEAGAAVVNMVSAYGGVRWESGLSRMFQYEKTQSRLGKSLWQDPKIFHYNSPIYELDKVKTPVLLMHNDEDGAVPWEQGIEYFMALRRLGKPAWLLNYNNEPHWPVKWQNRLDFNIRLEQFFDYYLMGTPMPLWMKEGNTPLEKGILNKY